jgi:membrane associated rhomboid family serine protease
VNKERKGDFSLHGPRNRISLLSRAAGHDSWTHLISNFSFILLVGPILEENYGSLSPLVMMILLASFTGFNRGEIPLAFILALVLYLGRELFNAFSSDSISEFARIAGGSRGSLFGFFRPPKR